MPEILHIDPQAFLHDTFRLGRKVYESGFRPKHVVSVWRGGTPVGLGVDAFFRSRGILLNHTTIATESYTGIQSQGEVRVKGLEHLVEVVCPEDGLLLVDDVLESGRTMRRILEVLRRRARANTPRDVRVATVHHKPERTELEPLPTIALHTLPGDVWIAYPHELSDLVRDDDPDDAQIRRKDEELWRMLRGEGAPIPEPGESGPLLLSPRELRRDAVRLGLQLVADESFRPDYLVALWPGGINAGLPVHEVYKYFHAKGRVAHVPDHISLSTARTRLSYRSDIIGINYLVENIGPEDQVLLIDTTFRSGQVINDVALRLKEALRRNLSLDRVRVAAVYHNREDTTTWTVPPTFQAPHYSVRSVSHEVIYPQSIHRLPDPHALLRRHDPALFEVLYG